MDRETLALLVEGLNQLQWHDHVDKCVWCGEDVMQPHKANCRAPLVQQALARAEAELELYPPFRAPDFDPDWALLDDHPAWPF